MRQPDSTWQRVGTACQYTRYSRYSSSAVPIRIPYSKVWPASRLLKQEAAGLLWTERWMGLGPNGPGAEKAMLMARCYPYMASEVSDYYYYYQITDPGGARYRRPALTMTMVSGETVGRWRERTRHVDASTRSRE